MSPTEGPRASEREGSAGQALVEFALVAPLLLVILIGIVEAGRYVLNLETLNNATREGARYAVVHGAQSSCPSGPMPGGATNPCESVEGENVVAAVQDAAIGIASLGELDVPAPTWTAGGSTTLPDDPDDTSAPAGSNYRGNYVTVWAEYSYEPIIKWVFDTELIPSITIDAESTLVINH